MNILVTGANGQLGREINLQVSGPQDQFYFTDVDDLDIVNMNSLKKYIEANNINLVINCAAYTAVDKAESEPEKAELINSIGPKNLATISQEYGVSIIHVSTDFVFDGKKDRPYIETDSVDPISVYGRTKLAGELEIINNASTFVIIRTSWLYSEFGNNFVKTILKLCSERPEIKVVSDQVGSPTYAKDLAKIILMIASKITTGTKEVFHYSNEGTASWYDFAVKIAELSKLNCRILSISTNEYPTSAKRPAYSVLDKTKIKKYLNINISSWQDSLTDCINHMRSNL